MTTQATPPRIRYGFNLDKTLASSAGGLVTLGSEAIRAGFDSVWVAARSYDAFQVCAALDGLTRGTGERVEIGIPVVPLGMWPSPVSLATSVATAADLSDGRFAIGFGTGHPTVPPDRYGPRERRPLAFVREYLTAVRGLLQGDTVDVSGPFLELHDASIDPPADQVPLYLGALGPEMLRLGGEIADGVVLNWASRTYVDWARARVAEGAQRLDRRPADIRVMNQIRVCISDDVDLATRTLARQLVSMMIRTPIERPDRGYRAHADRLGFEALFEDLIARREQGSTYDELAALVPASVVNEIAYAGPAAGAADAIRHLAGSADVALIRAVFAGHDATLSETELAAFLPNSG